MRQPRPLSLDWPIYQGGRRWDPPAPEHDLDANSTETPTLAAIAARLTPAQLEAWEASAFTTTQAAAAELLGKTPANVRQLMSLSRRRAIHAFGRPVPKGRKSVEGPSST